MNNMLKRGLDICLKTLVLLLAILFVNIGVRWLIAPGDIAPDFGFALSQGLGLSSQIGDMTGYFLTLGSCLLIALISGRHYWYYPPMMLLGITAIGRLVAWLVHNAAFAGAAIGGEVTIFLILLFTSRRLPKIDETDENA